MTPIVKTTPAFWVLLSGVIAGLILYNTIPRSLFSFDPPARPDGVPVQAVWIGGPDGGNFYACELSDKLQCTIFNDYSGEVEKRGTVELADWQRAKYRSITDVYE